MNWEAAAFEAWRAFVEQHGEPTIVRSHGLLASGYKVDPGTFELVMATGSIAGVTFTSGGSRRLVAWPLVVLDWAPE